MSQRPVNPRVSLAAIPIPDEHKSSAGFVHPFASYQQERKVYFVDHFVAVGGFGSVVRAHCDGENFAIKIQAGGDQARERTFRQEANYMKATRGKPNIVGYFGAFYFQGHQCLRLEWASMTLQQRLRTPITLKYARELCRGIATGLQQVHARNIVHRDLKSENVLISDTTNQPLICDFGLSGYLPEASSQLTGRCGTSTHWAKEMRDDKPYGEKVDCYAFGFVLRRILDQVCWDAVLIVEEVYAYTQSIDEQREMMLDLANHLMEDEPAARYSAEQALQHPFLAAEKGHVEQQGQDVQEVQEVQELDETERVRRQEEARREIVARFERQWLDTRGGSCLARLAEDREVDTISRHREITSV
ncbi:hypothetical protein BGW39_003537 [Mortierella sp. 14UC]|nr:hypothetical protein BGW39_003537 [Mortierella sp. 14UC]